MENAEIFQLNKGRGTPLEGPVCDMSGFHITKTRLFKYIDNFTTIKIENFQIKTPNNFHISVQNIDCGYSLELPHRGSSNEYPQSMF